MPVISPVEELIDNPVGRLVDDQVITGPPEFEGAETVFIAVPRANVIGESAPRDGATSFTVIEIVVDPEPPELVAVIVEFVAP